MPDEKKKEPKAFNRDDYMAVWGVHDKLGRTNDETYKVQAVLNKYGYNLEEDGFWGPNTKKAANKFIGDYSKDYMWNAMRSKAESLFE